MSMRIYCTNFWLRVGDHFEQFHAVIVDEGREASDHLVDEAAETPPVNFDAMALLPNDFGSQVLGGAADGLSLLLVAQNFGEPEISKLDVACFVDDDVLGLQAALQ